MHQLLIMGGGRIGSLIAFLLAHSNDYEIHLADTKTNNIFVEKLTHLKNLHYVTLDAKDNEAIVAYIKRHKIEGIVSSLPYFLNGDIAQIAKTANIHYFDLTEDVKTTATVRLVAKDAKRAFVPQCGIAPGFISIIANHLMQNFSSLNTVKLRVGALPMNISNALQYSLTWSTDGLINEYGNPAEAIENGKMISVLPLQGLEQINIDGLCYEAFNTSGGLGSLVETYKDRVNFMNYKTIRYPGHCEKIQFLMNDLQLNNDRETLKRIFEQAIPKTVQDVVLVYVSVDGTKQNEFMEENYFRKFYPKIIDGITWSAIQLTTATEICVIIDLVFSHPEKYQGFLKQEDFSLQDFLANRFGEYYR